LTSALGVWKHLVLRGELSVNKKKRSGERKSAKETGRRPEGCERDR